jgi:hypothetical protein
MGEVQVRSSLKSEDRVGAHNLAVDPAAVELVEQASSRIFDHRGGRGRMTSSRCQGSVCLLVVAATATCLFARRGCGPGGTQWWGKGMLW